MSKEHPFDTLLRRHCRKMSQLAAEENNSALAEAYEKLETKFANKISAFQSGESVPDTKPSRNLKCNF